MEIKILSIDVGHGNGWAFESYTGTIKFKSLHQYKLELKKLIDLYNPTLMVSCRPTFRIQVVAFQSKLLSIVELCAEEGGIQFYEGIDSEFKKIVLKNGRAKKPEIIDWAEKDLERKVTEHEADALMFARGLETKVI